MKQKGYFLNLKTPLPIIEYRFVLFFYNKKETHASCIYIEAGHMGYVMVLVEQLKVCSR